MTVNVNVNLNITRNMNLTFKCKNMYVLYMYMYMYSTWTHKMHAAPCPLHPPSHPYRPQLYSPTISTPVNTSPTAHILPHTFTDISTYVQLTTLSTDTTTPLFRVWAPVPTLQVHISHRQQHISQATKLLPVYTVGKARVYLLSPSDISVLFHEHYITNISEKYSPLYVLSFQNYLGFFRTSTFRDIWRKIPRFIFKIVCWFTLAPLHIYIVQLGWSSG